ncbi:MAG: glycosyltransferase family 2 protein [Bacteroidota bacterium]|nr:glycosyltransferase family 2 protein [Bacteroidota bacterium]
MRPKVGIVVPVLDEADSLPKLVNEISAACKAAGLTYVVYLIDDGSRDNSWASIAQLSREKAQIHGLRLRRNYGKSAALAAGFAAVDADIVITMDADLQDDPQEIPELVEMIESGHDLVSGWKKNRRDPIGKTLPSRFFNLVTRAVSKIPLHDFNCGLKAYRIELARSLKLYGEMHRYTPLLAKWEGFDRIGEKVVRHRPRKFGRSKYGWERYVRGCLDLLTVVFITRYGARPMHFFGTFGLLAFLAGFGLSLWISVNKLFFGVPVGNRPALLLGILMILVGVQTMCTGFIADLIIRSRMENSKPFNVREATPGPA